MAKEIDNIFVDVRNAFRLLGRYQKRILNTVSYIREQTPYTEMWGAKWYTNTIGNRKNSPDSEYAKLAIWKDMWGLDFLYGHIFEYYFGETKVGRHYVEMSIFQVSDDGFFISEQDNKHMTDVSSYSPAEDSHSYLILNTSVYTSKKREIWLQEFENEDYDDFLTRFLSSSEDTKIVKGENGEVCILKKYEIQNFINQKGADDVIRNYAKLISNHTDVKLFKDSYYSF